MGTKKHDNGHVEVPLMVRCGFGWLTFLAEILLLGSLGLVLFWVFYYGDGVAWSGDGHKQMNLHYILMIAGFIFMNGHAMLVYRSFPCCKKIYTKITHAIFFVLSISCIAVGMYAAIDAHSQGSSPAHFYTLHSWIGLTTAGLFALQFVFGFFSFLVLLCCDSATAKFRQRLLPTHVTFGLVIFSLAVSSSVTGLIQSARFRLSGQGNEPNYRNFPEEGIVINVLGMILIALAIVLPYIIRNSNYKKYTTLTIN